MRAPHPRFGFNQPEIEALHGYLVMHGWSLVARHELLYPGDEVGPGWIWRMLHVSGRQCATRCCNAADALVRAAAEEIEREPGLTRDLLEILEACEWRLEEQADQHVLVLAQPGHVRERFMHLLDPSRGESVGATGQGAHPQHPADANLSMLMPGSDQARHALRAFTNMPTGLAERGAGATARGSSLADALIAAFDHISRFTPWRPQPPVLEGPR